VARDYTERLKFLRTEYQGMALAVPQGSGQIDRGFKPPESQRLRPLFFLPCFGAAEAMP
jgi:hypothetical protein